MLLLFCSGAQQQQNKDFLRSSKQKSLTKANKQLTLQVIEVPLFCSLLFSEQHLFCSLNSSKKRSMVRFWRTAQKTEEERFLKQAGLPLAAAQKRRAVLETSSPSSPLFCEFFKEAEGLPLAAAQKKQKKRRAVSSFETSSSSSWAVLFLKQAALLLFCSLLWTAEQPFFSSLLFSSVLFSSLLFSSLLFSSLLFSSLLFCSLLFSSLLFCSLLFSSLLFCSLLFSSLLFSSLLFSSLLFSSLLLGCSNKRKKNCYCTDWLAKHFIMIVFLVLVQNWVKTKQQESQNNKANVAQLVEHSLGKGKVSGSSPVIGFFFCLPKNRVKPKQKK